MQLGELVRRAVACVLLGTALAGCGEDRTALDARLADGRAAFERGDASETRRIARELLDEHADDAEVQRLAAIAAWMRDDLDDAIDHARAGLERADPGDHDLRGALHLVAGRVAAQRYAQLRDPRDWGLANSHLEDATAAGSHRVDAALRLVELHASKDARADRARLLRFARLVVSIAPDSEEADKIRRLADAMGLSL